MDLYLVRHAIAERRDSDRWPDDAPRPLTPTGSKRFRAVARGLRRLGVGVDAVLASPYVRAWETAEILVDDAGWPRPEECPKLEPEIPASECVGVLRAHSEPALALVGHQPQLSHLASLLLTGDEKAERIQLKKGGVISLRFTERPAAGGAVLLWSASPRMLRGVRR